MAFYKKLSCLAARRPLLNDVGWKKGIEAIRNDNFARLKGNIMLRPMCCVKARNFIFFKFQEKIVGLTCFKT